MRDRIWLIVSQKGVTKMQKTERFSLDPGEVDLPVNVQIDDAVFQPVVMPTLVLEVPRGAVASEVRGGVSWSLQTKEEVPQ